MPPEVALDGPATAPAGMLPSRTSRLLRRIHMYLGLFLVPWMLMYALSTMVMNHRELVQSFYPTQAPAMVREREVDYTRTFAPETTPPQMGSQILADLGLEGAHRVTGGKDGKPLVIDRQHAWVPRRFTWDPATRTVLIEKQEFRSANWLERMHRRRGYQHPSALEDTWAFSVDLAVSAMVFWALSGLWLWWELRSTRLWGMVAGASGVVLFTLFLLVL